MKAVKIKYDAEADTLHIELRSLAPGAVEAKRLNEEIIASYGPDGKLAGLEILNAGTVLGEGPAQMVEAEEPDIEQRIKVDPKVRHGKPVIRDTRVPVWVVLGALGGGMTYEEVMEEYDLTCGDILAAIRYAAKVIGAEEEMPLEVEHAFPG
ncbi:MAG: DUF433 domain-containing protein [Anaerolineae bacterium]